jgi:hypothetical protein
MLTVETDTSRVEERLRSGWLACPGCAGVLTGWGRARARTVRGPDSPIRIVRRRSRCTGCGATHVLLPVLLLVRRADTAALIGAVFVARAAGIGHRRIAVLLGRPPGTVRGWLRRFAGRVEAVRVVFTRWCRALALDPVLRGPAGRVGVGGCGRRGDRRGPGADGQVLCRLSWRNPGTVAPALVTPQASFAASGGLEVVWGRAGTRKPVRARRLPRPFGCRSRGRERACGTGGGRARLRGSHPSDVAPVRPGST